MYVTIMTLSMNGIDDKRHTTATLRPVCVCVFMGFSMCVTITTLSIAVMHTYTPGFLLMTLRGINARSAYMHTYIHTYLHTYIPTYMHTYIHAYIPGFLLITLRGLNERNALSDLKDFKASLPLPTNCTYVGM